MVSHDNKELRAAIEKLHDCDDLDIDDALVLAETSVRALTALARGSGIESSAKIEEVADKVSRIKAGIAELQANHLRQQHIPEADRELSAMIQNTETAASRIMEAAEAIVEADAGDADAYRETVNIQVMAIFEACAFQDITGQRISKVRANLESIETRVSRFADAVGGADSDAPVSEQEKKREKRKKDLILNGPAQEGEGVSQAEIDSMLAS